MKRMFSPEIVCSDSFLEMSVSAQALYFHLGMRADDDGFVNPHITMRMIGSNSDDLKILIGKRFVMPFENGVVVIKHWRINNFVRKDRYRETLYTDEKNQLFVKENGIYTIDPKQGKHITLVPWKSDEEKRSTIGQPLVNAGKDRIGKDRIEKTHPVSVIGYLDAIPEKDMQEFMNRFVVTPAKVQSIAEDLKLYCQRKGKVYKNYKAFLLNAIKRDSPIRIHHPMILPDTPMTADERQKASEKLAHIRSNLVESKKML